MISINHVLSDGMCVENWCLLVLYGIHNTAFLTNFLDIICSKITFLKTVNPNKKVEKIFFFLQILWVITNNSFFAPLPFALAVVLIFEIAWSQFDLRRCLSHSFLLIVGGGMKKVKVMMACFFGFIATYAWGLAIVLIWEMQYQQRDYESKLG